MNEQQQRQYQEPKPRRAGDCEPEACDLSEQAVGALGQVAAVDAMIDNILSSATTGNYLESIRQRGGQ